MTRKRSNMRKKSGGRRRSVIKLDWDEGERRNASRSSYEKYGGGHISYSTESGAKGRAPKDDGVVIVLIADHSYAWYHEANRVPIQYPIIAIRDQGVWKGVEHEPGKLLIGKIREIPSGLTELYTNILNIEDGRLQELYDNMGYWTTTGSPPDIYLLQTVNRELSRATQNRASMTYAGSNDIADVYYITYFGKPTPATGGAGPRDQLRRTRNAVIQCAEDVPFLFEGIVGDISGEGDYTSHLIVFREGTDIGP